MRYNRVFEQAYDRVGTSVSKDRFAKIINPQALGMATRDEFYAPVRFNIQVTPHRTRGVVALDVPVHGNADWYQDMQESIAGMLGGKTEYADVIRFKTVTGEDLADIPHDQMRNVGTLNMYINGRMKRLKNVDPTKVPTEYSVTKGSDLKKWYKEVSESLPEVVACEMNKCSKPHEFDEIMSEGGVVQTAIENHLIKAAFPQEWTEFVRTHHVRSPKQLSEDVSHAVLEDVSSAILGFIRAHANASSDQIRAYMNISSSATSGGGGRKNLNAPILTSFSGPAGAVKEGGMDMYRRMVDGAVVTPALEQNVIRIIHTDSPALKKQRTNRVGENASSSSSSSSTLRVATSTADHHPWNAHIHHMLHPIKGAYPSDYLARHVHQDMRESAYYPGEPVKAYQSYHLFRGYHGVPPGVSMKAGKPVEGLMPIECHNTHKRGKKSKKGQRRTRDVDTSIVSATEWQKDKMVPIKQGIPEIVPIESHCHRKKDKRKDRKGEKYYDERLMESECPAVVPLRGEECPPVVPISSATTSRSDKKKKEPDEFAHLPQVADIFKD